MKIEIPANNNYTVVFADHPLDSYKLTVIGHKGAVITVVVPKKAIKRLARAS